MIIDNKKYKFVENFEQFLLGQGHDFTYSICNDKLFFPKFKTEKTAQVIYYSKKLRRIKKRNGKRRFDRPRRLFAYTHAVCAAAIDIRCMFKVKSQPVIYQIQLLDEHVQRGACKPQIQDLHRFTLFTARNLAQAINVNHGKKTGSRFHSPPVKIYTSRNINSMIIIQFFA